MAVYHLADKLKLTNRKIVVDIGANIGTASIPICAKNGLELIAVEASKENGALLLKNIANNKLKAKVFLCALVDEIDDVDEDFVELFINKGNTGANSLFQEWNPSKVDNKQATEFAQSKTLDELVGEARLNLDDVIITKIDVEGMEEAVLKGGVNFLRDNTAPIILEYRNEAMQRYLHKDLGGVVELLRRVNYEIYSFTGNSFGLGDFDPSQSYGNVVAVKKDSDIFNLLER
jgi:FkbM family methyltransferase